MPGEPSAWQTRVRTQTAVNCKQPPLHHLKKHHQLTLCFSFIAYRPLPHLNGKHTIFARIIDDPSPSAPTLNALETSPVESKETPIPDPPIYIKDVVIFVDPFEEFLAKKRAADAATSASVTGSASATGAENDEDSHVTWTGKRVRGTESDAGTMDGGSASSVGKYLKAAAAAPNPDEDEIIEYVDEYEEPEHARKKMKSSGGGGFGNFDSW